MRKTLKITSIIIISLAAIVGAFYLGLLVSEKILGSDATMQTAKTEDSRQETMDMSTMEHESSNSTSSQPMDMTGQSTVMITIDNTGLSSPDITINTGTVVTWINKDSKAHTVMAAHQGDTMTHTAPSADVIDNSVFASPEFQPEETYSFRFMEIGDISYHCALHPSAKGSVSVVE